MQHSQESASVVIARADVEGGDANVIPEAQFPRRDEEAPAERLPREQRDTSAVHFVSEKADVLSEGTDQAISSDPATPTPEVQPTSPVEVPTESSGHVQ